MSAAARPRQPRSGLDSGPAFVGALLVVSALGVARTQPRLAEITHHVKEGEEVYAFPPPAQLKAFVFGYDAAAVDLLWAKLLVEFGMHWHEKREFHPDPYMDAIVYLEPSYAPLYRFADTLLCSHPLHATESDARKARALLERGTRERPWDFEVWQQYGQYSAFLGPGLLTSATDEEKDRWRRDGALAMSKAVDLGAPAEGALSAATILGRTGETKAAIESLRRSYAVHYDDPEVRAEILRKLDRYNARAQNEEEDREMAAIESIWRNDWPFLTRAETLLLGPFPDAPLCAGPLSAEHVECTRDWRVLLGSDTEDAVSPEPR
jgi:hypothetical protein